MPEKYEKEVNELEEKVRIELATMYMTSKEGTKEYSQINQEELAKELGTNDNFVGEGVNDETWQSFILFMKVLSKTLKNFNEDPTIDLSKYRVGLYMGKAYRAAKMYANQQASKRGRLYNLWDRLGLEKPVPAFADYIRKINDMQHDEFDRFWTRHNIDENHNKSIFSNTDKLKLMDAAIQNVLLVQNLIHYGYVESYFPLHNEYELTGWSRDPTTKEDKIESDLRKAMGEEVYEFIEPEEKFLIPTWAPSPLRILSPPVNQIRDYFGEKIAYYFDFLALYTKFIMILVPIGIIIAVTLWAAKTTDDVTRVFIIIYGITNVL